MYILLILRTYCKTMFYPPLTGALLWLWLYVYKCKYCHLLFIFCKSFSLIKLGLKKKQEGNSENRILNTYANFRDILFFSRFSCVGVKIFFFSRN